ncbi:hypothetical protein NDU88_003557 [Pleurodeles waltl]|uniref:EamA domain-containing protein n=2 Tax=Pleurodeles waltl TaxID=8319 RepID=A0AAV7MSJ9_PLEWA|nr:hypothetical protein NDU88_003557 [Pleurodeles waltl]
MRRFSDFSPRRVSDISCQLCRRLGQEGPVKAALRSCRSFVDVTSPLDELSAVEVRILSITGYYGRQAPRLWGSPGQECGGSVREKRSSSGPVDVESSGETPSRWLRCFSRTVVKNLACGAVTATCMAMCWASMIHLARLSLRSLDAPFFTAWFATNWNCLFFPAFYVGHVYSAQPREPPLKYFRYCGAFLGLDNCTPHLALRRVGPFCLLWTLSSYLLFLALQRIGAGDAAVLFCCNKAFVFLLSWIVLKDRFMGVRIVAVILSITGIVMLAYADGFHSDSIMGVALAVAAASTSALYKVLFKLLIGAVKLGEASAFLTMLGVLNAVFLSWVPVLLHFTHVETWSLDRHVPWDQLCGVSALFFVFNALVNFGAVFTYSTMLSIGVFLSVAASTALDFHTSGAVVFTGTRLAASAAIGAGFLLLLLPEDWDEVTVQLFTSWREKKREEGIDESPDSGMQFRTKNSISGLSMSTAP